MLQKSSVRLRWSKNSGHFLIRVFETDFLQVSINLIVLNILGNVVHNEYLPESVWLQLEAWLYICLQASNDFTVVIKKNYVWLAMGMTLNQPYSHTRISHRILTFEPVKAVYAISCRVFLSKCDLLRLARHPTVKILVTESVFIICCYFHLTFCMGIFSGGWVVIFPRFDIWNPWNFY